MNGQRKIHQHKTNRLFQRTPTVTDRAIIAEIADNPGLTGQEYADRLGIRATFVHDAILYTKEGLALAQNDKILVARHGRTPKWASFIKKPHVTLRIPDNQLTPKIMPTIGKTVRPDVKSEFAERAHLLGEAMRTNNPSRRAQLMGRIKSVMEADVATIESKDRHIENLMKRVEEVISRCDATLAALAKAQTTVAIPAAKGQKRKAA